MKSFKQFDESHSIGLDSVEDDNLGLFNVQDPESLQKLNGFAVSTAELIYFNNSVAFITIYFR